MASIDPDGDYEMAKRFFYPLHGRLRMVEDIIDPEASCGWNVMRRLLCGVPRDTIRKALSWVRGIRELPANSPSGMGKKAKIQDPDSLTGLIPTNFHEPLPQILQKNESEILAFVDGGNNWIGTERVPGQPKPAVTSWCYAITAIPVRYGPVIFETTHQAYRGAHRASSFTGELSAQIERTLELLRILSLGSAKS